MVAHRFMMMDGWADWNTNHKQRIFLTVDVM